MSCSTRGIQLHRDASLKDFPPIPQAGARFEQIAAFAGHGNQKTLRAIEGALGCGESVLGQLGCQNSVAGSKARVERLASRHDGAGVRALLGEWESSIAAARRDLRTVVGMQR